jgi:hypothetical protein
MGPRHLWDPFLLGQLDTHEVLLDPSNTIKNVFQIKDLFFKVSLEFISKKTLNPLFFFCKKKVRVLSRRKDLGLRQLLFGYQIWMSLMHA